MSSDERRAAAAAAREWEADRQRTQQLLSRLADRAEAAELALMEARSCGYGGGAAVGRRGGSSGAWFVGCGVALDGLWVERGRERGRGWCWLPPLFVV